MINRKAFDKKTRRTSQHKAGTGLGFSPDRGEPQRAKERGVELPRELLWGTAKKVSDLGTKELKKPEKRRGGME